MISVIINVKNGQRHLKSCLNALTRFDDVVVFDNGSTDQTIAIAKLYPNVRVFESHADGMGLLRNLAATHAYHDWIFCVDSDEIVSQRLVDRILSLSLDERYIYRVLRHNYYANYQLTASSWENDWVLRIYNRQKTQFNDLEVHESLITAKLQQRKIKAGPIYHFPYANVAELIDKTQLYSTWYAKQNYARKKISLSSIPFRAFLMFLKCYILKRGFLHGYEGFTVSSFNAIGVFVKYIKLYELSYKRKFGLAIGVIEDIAELVLLIEQINQQTLLPDIVIVLVDDKLFSLGRVAEIQKLLDDKLIVPSKIIGEVDQDINMVLNSYLIERPELNNIAYISQNSLLNKRNCVQRIKQSVLADADIPDVTMLKQLGTAIRYE